MFCSVKQLAKKKGVSKSRILFLIQNGKFEAFKIGHDWRIYYKEDEIGCITRSRRPSKKEL